MSVRIVPFLAALVAASVATSGLRAQETKADRFHGSDGKFDTSAYLATRGGFLPVPLVITEPAVGYGGGIAAVFFHGGNPLTKARRAEGARPIPPSITGAGAFATENGSKGGGIAHFGVWKEDRIRYIGVAGAASLNLDYWGTSNRPLSDPLRYGVDGAIIIQRLQFRVKDTPLFLGGEWSWSTQKAEFKSLVLPPDSPPRKVDQDDSGVGLIAEFETLDNIFSPRSGMKARVLGKVFSESLGGDNDRQTLDLEAFGYVPVRQRFLLGMRADVALSDGDTPFYLLPYVKLRGLPAIKYTGKHAASGELEGQWNFHGRWTAVAFGGLGFTGDSVSDLGQSGSLGTVGAGFRYLIAEKLGLQTGLDFARGPDDHAIYIIVGSAWR